MSVNWKDVKRALRLERRQVVNVHLPEYDEADAEARIDRDSDAQRRDRLADDPRKAAQCDEGTDRHEVRELYRGLYGQP